MVIETELIFETEISLIGSHGEGAYQC